MTPPLRNDLGGFPHLWLSLVGSGHFSCLHLKLGFWQIKMDEALLSEDALEAFQALKQACMTAPILTFTDYTKDFLLETDASKEGGLYSLYRAYNKGNG